MRVVVTADTHVPRRARDLPAELWAAIDGADAVVHAGDWVDVSLLTATEQRAKRVIGVVDHNRCDLPPGACLLHQIHHAGPL